MTVEQIVAQVRVLSPEEKQMVRVALDQVPEDDESLRAREEAWLQQMVERGLVKRPRPLTPEEVAKRRKFQPAVVLGKPVSQTIIEDRR